MHASGFMTFSVSNGCFGQEKTPLLQANICEGFCLVFFPSDKPNHVLLVRFRGKTGHFHGHRTPLARWKDPVKKHSEEKGKYEHHVHAQ